MPTRRERVEETRRRIVEAAVALHTSVGPARTSIKAVAERAGVQRHTVYAHFPTESELFRACSAHWEAAHPFPDVSAWAAISDRERRLRRALSDLYAWYAQVGDDLALFARDADSVPGLAAEDARRQAALRDLLLPRGSRRRRAALGHALDFGTWRSLRRQGLSDPEAVDLMLRLVASV